MKNTLWELALFVVTMLAVGAVAAVVIVIGGAVTQWLWNIAAVGLFNAKEATLMHGIALSLLAGILFGGVSRR